MSLETIIIASTITSAVGSIQAGQAAAAAGQYQNTVAQQNAQIYEQKAEQSKKIGEYNLDRFNRDFNKTLASTERAYFASGVDVTRGTPISVLRDYMYEAELERANIKYNAEVQATDYRESALISRMEGNLALYQGKQAQTASYFKAGTTLLGGAEKLMV